jgi:D-sedoheptulose 7-phosphate isomerase
MKNSISRSLEESLDVLNEFMKDPEQTERIAEAAITMSKALNRGNKILTCGNGGSMADAMHFAQELTGRFRQDRPSIPAISISDPTHITCTGNDYGFEYIFSRYIEGVGHEGDVLLAISTSGNSTNIIRAAETALEKGMKVVALTGKGGGLLAKLASVEIRVPGNTFTDRIQEVHIKVIHLLIELIEKEVLG